MHGGTVAVISQGEGCGSTFIVDLPVYTNDNNTSSIHASGGSYTSPKVTKSSALPNPLFTPSKRQQHHQNNTDIHNQSVAHGDIFNNPKIMSSFSNNSSPSHGSLDFQRMNINISMNKDVHRIRSNNRFFGNSDNKNDDNDGFGSIHNDDNNHSSYHLLSLQSNEEKKTDDDFPRQNEQNSYSELCQHESSNFDEPEQNHKDEREEEKELKDECEIEEENVTNPVVTQLGSKNDRAQHDEPTQTDYHICLSSSPSPSSSNTVSRESVTSSYHSAVTTTASSGTSASSITAPELSLSSVLASQTFVDCESSSIVTLPRLNEHSFSTRGLDYDQDAVLRMLTSSNSTKHSTYSNNNMYPVQENEEYDDGHNNDNEGSGKYRINCMYSEFDEVGDGSSMNTNINGSNSDNDLIDRNISSSDIVFSNNSSNKSTKPLNRVYSFTNAAMAQSFMLSSAKPSPLHSARTDTTHSSSSSRCSTARDQLNTFRKTSSIRPMRFLVVDDSSASRKMLSKLLVSCGHSVAEAKDGLHCLEMCHCSRTFLNESKNIAPTLLYDVILIDDAMPNLSGPEAVIILRRNVIKTLIIGLTGSTDEVTRNKFINSGANEVLTKPLDIDKLTAILNCHLI